MEQWGVTAAETAAYLAAHPYQGGAAGLKQIAYEKWVSLFNLETEAYAEYRRLDYPVLKPGPEARDEHDSDAPAVSGHRELAQREQPRCGQVRRRATRTSPARCGGTSRNSQLISASSIDGARDTTPHACMHAWGVVRLRCIVGTARAWGGARTELKNACTGYQTEVSLPIRSVSAKDNAPRM